MRAAAPGPSAGVTRWGSPRTTAAGTPASFTDQLGRSGKLVGNRDDGDRQRVAIGVGVPAQVVAHHDAGSANREVDDAVAPRPARGVGDHDPHLDAEELEQPVADRGRGLVGMLREQRDFAPIHVGLVDAGSQHEAVPGLGDGASAGSHPLGDTRSVSASIAASRPTPENVCPSALLTTLLLTTTMSPARSETVPWVQITSAMSSPERTSGIPLLRAPHSQSSQRLGQVEGGVGHGGCGQIAHEQRHRPAPDAGRLHARYGVAVGQGRPASRPGCR